MSTKSLIDSLLDNLDKFRNQFQSVDFLSTQREDTQHFSLSMFEQAEAWEYTRLQVLINLACIDHYLSEEEDSFLHVLIENSALQAVHQDLLRQQLRQVHITEVDLFPFRRLSLEERIGLIVEMFAVARKDDQVTTRELVYIQYIMTELHVESTQLKRFGYEEQTIEFGI
ncbi:TerB family tellurite resistance protein [Algivirga pacifica]|uniref:Co-chaperone DjlA N-terminal domain-containing protein n=1 Tax=Algivirga pacifica TaxID=1162670 RepID=A0ABP9CVI4_9BACT